MVVSGYIFSNLWVEHSIVNPQKVGSKPASHSEAGESGGKKVYLALKIENICELSLKYSRHY